MQWKNITLLLFLLSFVFQTEAQRRKRRGTNTTTQQQVSTKIPEKVYESLKWRNIGPFRGGRSCAVTGVAGKPNLFYFGSTGGGIWRTKDGGGTWENISDGFFGGSIGAIAVSEYDNNVIYVGGGEKTVRGNVSFGYGVWKSTDAGKTWQQMGLKASRHIARIRIHPKNPNLVYAAVLGNLFASSEERGVYRSKDGGQTWERILFANADAGAVDLLLDPNNARVVYATTWRIRRSPYSLSSGGEGSGLWKSTNGGDTWTNISRNDGLPKGVLGISAIAVSPVNSERVWAIIEAKDGGVFRSEDAGKTWKKLNESRALRQRAWYYTRIYADTQDEDKVYVMNVRYHKSTDGGKTFKPYVAPHGDHHDLWIAPEDPNRMIIGDDGGAQVSFDGGENWSTYLNQPTAQFYRVTTDNAFPYRIYAAQQDNSTIRINHRSSGGSITESDWESTAGGESAHIAPDPKNNDIVYGGSYDGFLTRVDHATKQVRAVNVWPDNPMGHGAEGMKYRFQWNFPIFFSPHNPNKLYTASNHLHVSEDEGHTWKIISPDLTRNDSTKLKSSGGPITQDNTSVEYYCTIFAAAESPREEGHIWVGSDDGLVHLTKDGGKNWENITPKEMPEWTMINSLEISPYQDGAAYIAATGYKLGDFAPYLYKTTDYGKSWTKITNGIPAEHFTRVVRADPKRKGLLYAGTETGMYVSFDDGANWQAFQLNLPIVPITDLAIKNDNLIAATQGRSLWIIDDLTVLHQAQKEIAEKAFHLYQPMPSYRMRGGQWGNSKKAGTNHPGGVMVHFYLKDKPDSTTTASIEFLEADGTLIRKYDTKSKTPGEKFTLKDSANVFTWNMRYPNAKKFKGMILWWGSTSGPQAVPGKYKVRLTLNGESQEQAFEILKDPRNPSTQAELQAQFDFLMDIRNKLSETHQAIIDIREIKGQMNAMTKRIQADSTQKEVIEMAKEINKQLSAIEKTLYQTKNRSGQDPLNFPIRLNNKLAHIASLTSMGDFPPTQSSIQVKEELVEAIDAELAKYQKIVQEEIPKFNQLVKQKAIDAIIIQSGDDVKSPK
ncbi:MAG: VPS10 domain-containing protein [Flammeovirgaceae bacterium]